MPSELAKNEQVQPEQVSKAGVTPCQHNLIDFKAVVAESDAKPTGRAALQVSTPADRAI